MWIKFYLRKRDEEKAVEIARVRDRNSARVLEAEYVRIYNNGDFFLSKKEGRKKEVQLCSIVREVGPHNYHTICY